MRLNRKQAQDYYDWILSITDEDGPVEIVQVFATILATHKLHTDLTIDELTEYLKNKIQPTGAEDYISDRANLLSILLECFIKPFDFYMKREQYFAKIQNFSRFPENKDIKEPIKQIREANSDAIRMVDGSPLNHSLFGRESKQTLRTLYSLYYMLYTENPAPEHIVLCEKNFNLNSIYSYDKLIRTLPKMYSEYQEEHSCEADAPGQGSHSNDDDEDRSETAQSQQKIPSKTLPEPPPTGTITSPYSAQVKAANVSPPPVNGDTKGPEASADGTGTPQLQRVVNNQSLAYKISQLPAYQKLLERRTTLRSRIGKIGQSDARIKDKIYAIDQLETTIKKYSSYNTNMDDSMVYIAIIGLPRSRNSLAQRISRSTASPWRLFVRGNVTSKSLMDDIVNTMKTIHNGASYTPTRR